MIEKIKKGLYLLLLVLGLIVCSEFSFGRENYIRAGSSVKNSYKVIVDAGHGGFDGGAVAMDGTSEKNINLKIARKLKALLEFNGYSVIMTRTDDSAINDYGSSIHTKKKSDMQNRLSVMEENKDAVFVSIHLNKFTTSSASGAQIFYSDNFEESKILAESVRKSVVDLLEPYNNRTIKKGTSGTYLLYNAKTPAIIAECGFISNKTDLENLKTDEFQSKMAFAIANGIINFYGSEE